MMTIAQRAEVFAMLVKVRRSIVEQYENLGKTYAILDHLLTKLQEDEKRDEEGGHA